MSDIYSIPNWGAATVYNENDIVINGNNYYYARIRHTSTSNFQNDINNNYWKGILNYNGEIKPYFEWKPSYGYSLNIKPLIKSIQFGDGYSQTIGDGINNILLPFDVTFADRSLSEYAAILHFLNARGGFEKFYYILPSPFNVVKRFICSEWSPTQTFYDKYTIAAKFEEKV